MRTDNTDGTIRYSFSSLQEVQRYIDETPRTWSRQDSRNTRASHDWDLNTGYDNALALARDGWQSGGETLFASLAQLPALDAMPDRVLDVAGYAVDYGAFASGEPECMYTLDDNADTGAMPIVTLAVPVNAVADVTAECMKNYGLAVARYVDELEATGISVELVAAIVSIVSGERVVHSWTVKASNHQMDFNSVAFSIGHPAMFRRLGFALRERAPVRQDDCYGQSMDLVLSDLIDPTHGTIILNGMRQADRVAYTPEKALDTVGKQIAAAMLDFQAPSID